MTKSEIFIAVGLFVSIVFLFIIIGVQQSMIAKYKMMCNGYNQRINTYQTMIVAYEYALGINQEVKRIRGE